MATYDRVAGIGFVDCAKVEAVGFGCVVCGP